MNSPGQEEPNMLLEKSREIAPEGIKRLSQKGNNAPVWMSLVVKVKSDAVKNIASWLVESEGAEPIVMDSCLSFVGPGTFLEGEMGAVCCPGPEAALRPPVPGQRACATRRDSRARWACWGPPCPTPHLTMVLVSTQPCLCARCHRLTDSWLSLLLRRSPWAKMLLKKERPNELWRFKA